MNKIGGLFQPNNQNKKMGEIVINVSENGKVSAELVEKKAIQLEELETVLSELERRGKGNNKEKMIVVRANSKVPYEFISQAVKIIKLMGGENVNLITETSLPLELPQINLEVKYIDGVTPISKIGEQKIEDDYSEKDLLSIYVSYANIRSGPGIGYAVVRRTKRGNPLYKVNQESGSWI